MPRLRRCLCSKIIFNPEVDYFKPKGVPMRDLKTVEISIEELEAYRLRHIENIDQIESSKKMGLSQSTFQRLLDSVNKKIADALVNGKAIRIIRHK